MKRYLSCTSKSNPMDESFSREPMTSSTLFHIAIKIFGLHFVILTVINLRDIIAATSAQLFMSNNDGILVMLFHHIYYVVLNATVALILLFKTAWVAEKLQLSGSETLNIQADKTDWIELAIIVISALAVLHAFPEILYKLVHYTYFLIFPTQPIHVTTPPKSQNTFEKITEYLPLALIALGLALEWLKFAYAGLILIVGFLLYGIFGVIISIKRKYYKGITIRFFKLINDIAIILLAIALFFGQSTIFFLLMLILLDRLILLPRA